MVCGAQRKAAYLELYDKVGVNVYPPALDSLKMQHRLGKLLTTNSI